jgi:hypothetical protein
MVRPRPARVLAILAVPLVLAPACGDDNGGGHATLRFSGAVTGTVDADLDVDCFKPAEQGDNFSVSIDSDDGAPVGDKKLNALDFAAPEYDRPRDYDLSRALAGAGFDGEGLFLLFEEYEQEPFLWGDEQRSSGTVSIDPGERSGRLSLRGWENGGKLRVDVEGTFVCGEQETR